MNVFWDWITAEQWSLRELDGGFECRCDEGYSGDGVARQDIDECLGGIDDALRMHCVPIFRSYRCDCNSGYRGDGLIAQTSMSASKERITVQMQPLAVTGGADSIAVAILVTPAMALIALMSMNVSLGPITVPMMGPVPTALVGSIVSVI